MKAAGFSKLIKTILSQSDFLGYVPDPNIFIPSFHIPFVNHMYTEL